MASSDSSFELIAARRRMVKEQLRARGIKDERVLAAMETVPRHSFLSGEQAAHAYDDAALPSEEGQTISQPYMVAVMSEALRVSPGMRVLELGTGTGYQTAILAALAKPGRVCSIERFAALAQHAGERLRELGVDNVEIAVGDGTLGWPAAGATFERILITAAAPQVPGPVEAQLADGGILVAPIGKEGMQTLMRLTRRGAAWDREAILECRFVPLIGEHGFGG